MISAILEALIVILAAAFLAFILFFAFAGCATVQKPRPRMSACLIGTNAQIYCNGSERTDLKLRDLVCHPLTEEQAFLESLR